MLGTGFGGVTGGTVGGVTGGIVGDVTGGVIGGVIGNAVANTLGPIKSEYASVQTSAVKINISFNFSLMPDIIGHYY